MIASVHVADVGGRAMARALLRRPKVGEVPGLRSADTALFAPLAPTGPPRLTRAGLIALWDDEDAVDQFVKTHPMSRLFADGFRARLRPLRAYGTWPGLPADVPDSRAVPHDGPVVVLTLGRLRISQAVRFLRASRPAEAAARDHPGLIWGSAAVRPPFLATVSIWKDARTTAEYAYGHQAPAHLDAITEQQRKDFHHQSAFIRFAPLRLEGALLGKNPLDASTVSI